MKAKEIIEVLEKFAPLGIQEKWDNSGLSIGSPETEVSGVLFALDCTVDLIKEAKAKGANMVVTHHPLLFHGVKKIIPGDPVADAIIEAIRSEILIYALHTPADKVVSGVSWKMAEKLGLVDIEILAQEEGGVGLGTIGKLAEPLVGEKAIVDYVKNAFSLPALRTSKPVEKVTKIAMCGGAGADFIDLARRKGAELYISADFHYHHFFTPENFMIMDVGHYESEKYIVEVLISLLNQNFSTFAALFSEGKSSNPIRYY